MLLAAIVLALLAGSLAPQDADATALTRVYINGHAVPVSFNDGDSFRVQSGEYSGSQCRLSGFNTLESFGPAHQWGTWHPYELYINAKQATTNGRRGTWHCFADGSRDGYGRLLVDCPDLALDQIRRGYAQAYQVDDTPARPEYLRAQQEAIAARRGMWAHGVPQYIMTSIHSADEDPGREWHYNRLISTRDGHSESYRHRETYSQCEWVCNQEIVPDLVAVSAAAERMRQEPTLLPHLSQWSALLLTEFAARYSRLHELPEYLTGTSRAPIEAWLAQEDAAGRLGRPHTEQGACMLYVDFTRRYGRSRAECLQDHGTLPPNVPDIWHLSSH